MAQENEDNEIDRYLVEKIGDAIDHLGEPKNLVAKSYSFKNELMSLLNDLRKTRNPSIPKEHVWLGVRRGNLYTLNNLVTEWQQITKIQTSFASKEVYEACENMKKSMRKMKKDINGDPESSQRGDTDESRRSYDDEEQPETFLRHTKEVYRWSSRHEPRKVHGIDHRVLAMVRELVMRNTDAPFKVFGVVGISGIGKTTLCQTLFGNDFVKQHFSPRIWVCLSKQEKVGNEYYKEEILVRILKCLGIEDERIDDARKAGGLKKLVENEYYKEESLVRMLKCLGIIKEELLNRCDGIPLAAKLLAKIACKNLDIKSKGPKPLSAGGDSGAHVSEIGDDQTA
ncbi:putative P-loop containing nucleoside triphosphate hydrolase [Helianthus annuus]|nr:putative P-loop containing nucleoside triphosphate hydrolase [Helianthus annuus]